MNCIYSLLFFSSNSNDKLNKFMVGMYLVPIFKYKFKRHLQILSYTYCPHNLTKYESKRNSKIPIFQLISEMGEIRKCSLG